MNMLILVFLKVRWEWRESTKKIWDKSLKWPSLKFLLALPRFGQTKPTNKPLVVVGSLAPSFHIFESLPVFSLDFIRKKL